jgi:hypothetical protein
MRTNLYTATERTIVLKWLQQYPDNLKHAFEKASEEIGTRESRNLAVKYYTCWKNEEDFLAVTVGSKKGFTQNVKNTKRVEGIFPEERTLNSVGWLVKNFLNLSSKEQKQFTDILVSIGTINIASPVIKGNNNKVSIK